MSLPWHKVSTLDPISSIARGAWESKPPEWVMRHEFSAIVAAGLVNEWSLTQLADRWLSGRRLAKRVLKVWLEQATANEWDAAIADPADPKSTTTVIKAHPWLAPVVPLMVEILRPGEGERSQVDTVGCAPAVPRSRPGNAPLACASPIGEGDGDLDGEPPKAPQGAKRKRAKPEPWKPSEALTLLAGDISTAWEAAPGADQIAWGVDGPQARRSRLETLGWWLGELPVKRQPKAVYTPDRIRAAWAVFLAEDWARDPGRGITTFLRATQLPKWTEAGGTPQDTAPQTAPPPEPDLSGLSVGELVDLESNQANIQALRRRRKQESV